MLFPGWDSSQEFPQDGDACSSAIAGGSFSGTDFGCAEGLDLGVSAVVWLQD
jgi:hypothetical protein